VRNDPFKSRAVQYGSVRSNELVCLSICIWERERAELGKKSSLSNRCDGVAAILQVTNEERETWRGENRAEMESERGAV